ATPAASVSAPVNQAFFVPQTVATQTSETTVTTPRNEIATKWGNLVAKTDPAYPQALSFGATYANPNTQVIPGNLVDNIHECGNGGSKGSVYLTYDGTPGDPTVEDENLAVAAGKGADLGKAFAAGYKGDNRSLTIASSNGSSCTAVTILGSASAPVKVNDIAVNSNGIYVVGTVGNDSFIQRRDSSGALLAEKVLTNSSGPLVLQ